MMTMVKGFVKKMVGFFTAAAMTAAMAAFIPASASASAADEVADAQLRSMANEVAIMVNDARRELGLPEIYVVPYLNEIATDRSVEITVEFAHSRLDGSKFTTIIDTDIVPYTYAAENIAAGSDTAKGAFEQWKNSPSHWKAITSNKITHMGIGVTYDPDGDYVWYWQQTFIKTDKEFEDQYLPTEYEIVPKADGDLNGDAIVDSYDYLILCDYIYKKNTDEAVYLNNAQLETADCFKDGIITEADAKVMMRYLLGEYKTLPFEF